MHIEYSLTNRHDLRRRSPALSEQFSDAPKLCAPVDKFLCSFENAAERFYKKHTSLVKLVGLTVLCDGYLAYLMVACLTDFNRARDLFAITIFAVFCIAYWRIKELFGDAINTRVIAPIVTAVESKWKLVKW